MNKCNLNTILRLTLFIFGLLLYSGQQLLAANSNIPKGPKVNAKGYILVDFNSGRVLAEKNADTRMEPASLTKMMSSYVVAYALENSDISFDDKVRVSKKAWRMKGSRMFIEAGKKIPLEHLIKGMIVQSGNDATIALAE
ncbi:MAG: D-alanyl-D-alanine carboxypeptidase family protein, partial [Thiohalomonadales bacterium]